ncbi:hypothetical protein PM082_021184 [Marasmius tenuissimus]|nr:hypothetical protein PM082_021184 [Marasmius tenuissimus]
MYDNQSCQTILTVYYTYEPRLKKSGDGQRDRFLWAPGLGTRAPHAGGLAAKEQSANCYQISECCGASLGDIAPILMALGKHAIEGQRWWLERLEAIVSELIGRGDCL